MSDTAETSPKTMLPAWLAAFLTWARLCWDTTILAAREALENARATFESWAPSRKLWVSSLVGLALCVAGMWALNALPARADLPSVPSFASDASVARAIADSEAKVTANAATKDELLQLSVKYTAAQATLLSLSARIAALEQAAAARSAAPPKAVTKTKRKSK